MMRYLLICKPTEGMPAWVAAETPMGYWAKDTALLWRDWIVLTREEAELDPDYAEAAAEWARGDDSRYAATEAVFDADTVIRDALPDEIASVPNRTYRDTKSAEDIDVLNTFHEIQARYVAETVRYMREGRLAAAAQLARLIYRDAKSVAGMKTGDDGPAA